MEIESDKMVIQARETARKAHAGQKRRDGKDYFEAHLSKVAARVRNNPWPQTVAWLHDILEDTATTEEDLLKEGFNPYIVDVVKALTKNKTWIWTWHGKTPKSDEKTNKDYKQYLWQVCQDPLSLEVKIADVQSNLEDCVNQLDNTQLGYTSEHKKWLIKKRNQYEEAQILLLQASHYPIANFPISEWPAIIKALNFISDKISPLSPGKIDIEYDFVVDDKRADAVERIAGWLLHKHKKYSMEGCIYCGG